MKCIFSIKRFSKYSPSLRQKEILQIDLKRKITFLLKFVPNKMSHLHKGNEKCNELDLIFCYPVCSDVGFICLLNRKIGNK